MKKINIEKKIEQWKDILNGKDTSLKPIRVYQIAKELNVHHKNIIEFLNDSSVKDHMSKVNIYTYNILISSFNDEKSIFEKENKSDIAKSEKNEIILKNVIKKYQSALGKFQVNYIESTIEKK
tara:strand:- start:75 stop:443 length:369 start_codon:yes stop_codon:yes gene_type:complete